MELYVLKSAACLALFFVFYKAFLERENMHGVKRFFLLGSLIASFSIPFITFIEYSAPSIRPVPVFTSEMITVAQTEIEVAPNYLPIILWAVYGIGFLIFGIRFGKNLFEMIQKIRQNPRHKNQNLFHVLLKTPVTPHTFFSYIFLHRQKFENNEIPKEVLDHEATHARELHSIDVLFIELLQVIFWFNPLLYFIKQSIKLNHEFLADRAVLTNGADLSQYQKTLLAFSSSANSPTMANSINYSSFKKRFTVMKTHTSRSGVWLRSLLLLPLLAGLIYSFSSTEMVEKPISELKADYATTYLKGAARNNTKAFVLIVNQNNILLNGQPSSLETLTNDIDEITESWEETDYTSAMPSILISESTSSFVELLNNAFKKTHYSKANEGIELNYGETYQDEDLNATPEQVAQYNAMASYWNAHFKETAPERTMPLNELRKLEVLYHIMSSSQQENAEPFPHCDNPIKATPAQLAEYNKLAKKYNNMPRDNMRIKGKELTRMQYIYDLMTPEQRKSAEPFPNLPPPPPPPNAPYPPEVIKGVNDTDTNIPPPPPPPTPVSPLDHVISMAKKGATFYYEGKKVSSDKAIEVLKKNPNLNIDSRNHNSKKPEVRISKKPITINKSVASNTPSINIQTPTISLNTGNIKINGEDYFYSTKNGVTSYFDRFGTQVDENGERLGVLNKPSPTFYYNGVKVSSERANSLLTNNSSIQVTNEDYQNGEYAVILTNLNQTNTYNHNKNVNNTNSQDPLIDLTDVIKKGATFYLNDVEITTEMALKLTKKLDAISRVQVIEGANGKPKVYFWNDAKMGLRVPKEVKSSTSIAMGNQDSSLGVLYVNIPNIGPAPDYNNVPAMLDLMVEHKADFFLDGKSITKDEAARLIKDHKKVEILTIDKKHTGEKAHFNNNGRPTIHFMDKSCYKHSPHHQSKQL